MINHLTHGHTEAEASHDDGNKTKTASDGWKWQTESQQVRLELGLGPTDRPWTGRRGVTLQGLKRQPRTDDIIDLVWARMCKKMGVPLTSDKPARGLFCDPSQSVSRAGA
eukprot:2185096-Lingulodinium_polyedra.AAC.1